MNSNKNLTPLTSNNNAIYKVVDGVIYFKLKSEFDGDYTKHCGLLGEEIDKNFYFLRGYDIDSIFVDENRNLIINRVDKDYAPLVVNIGEELEHPKFDLNKNTGTITVTYPDGTTSKMEGFLIEGQDIRIVTDGSLTGNGTIFNPLRLTPIERTGTLAPANEYYDLTNGNEFNKIPDGKGKGYRVVTKEKKDNFGYLYSYDAVEAIQKDLIDSGSQWRIPSKADWDELLDALECPEDRNHSASTCNWLGRFAGSGLKSANMWKEFVNLPTEDSVIGQDVKGLTIYPVGITSGRNGALSDSSHDIEGFTQIAGMWTTTKDSDDNVYVKIFGYNSAKVNQDTYGDGARMSIRLVKDYSDDNYEKIETILGLPYPTELVYGIHDDYKYAKVWTKINFYEADKYNGIRSEEWSAVTNYERGIKIMYFINEWDGTRWDRKPLSNGESIVIIDKDGLSYHEWRIINEELIDVADALVIEFNKDFSEVNESIVELSAKTQEIIIFSGFTIDTINEFSGATGEHINNINGRIDLLTNTVSGLSASTIDEVVRIDEEISNVSASTVAEVIRIDEEIGNVSASTIAEVVRIDEEISNVSASTVAEVVRIDGEISNVNELIANLSSSTISEINRIDEDINTEKNERIANDLTPGTYVLEGDYSSEMVIPTNSTELPDVKIKVSNDFFNFGEF